MKEAILFIDVRKLLFSRQARCISATRLGEIVLGIYDEAMRGQGSNALALPWIRRVRFIRNRQAIPTAVRDRILAAGKCAVCPAREDLEVDHIYPVSRGGGDEETNLQCLCSPCNSDKRAKTMEEWLPKSEPNTKKGPDNA